MVEETIGCLRKLAIRVGCERGHLVPIPLILLFGIELNGAPSLLVHCLGAVLVLSRIAHPFGVAERKLRTAARGLGSLGTLAVTLIAAGFGTWEFAVR